MNQLNRWIITLRKNDRRYKNSSIYRGLGLFLSMVGALQCFAVCWVLYTGFFDPLFNYLVVKEMLKTKKFPKQILVPYHHIAEPMKRAVISTEDARFMMHHGIDFEAIEQAEKRNKKRKQKAGASTITQQVAKNLFLWPGRSFIRKALELYFTAIMESFWSKKKILNKYLNWAEMGQGVYGVEAAATHYFNKSASALTSKEAASIAAILPNPRVWSAKRPSPYLKTKIRRIERRMPEALIP